MKLPMCKWKEHLDDWRSSGLGGVRHNDDYKTYIKDIIEQNWTVCEKSVKTMNRGPHSLIDDIYTVVRARPDKMQISIAMFAVASLHKRPKQMWQLPSGQGKSRIIAAAGLHAL